VIEPEQLDIFILLQRRERFQEWAQLARDNDLDLEDPGRLPAFATWLRDSGHAPAGVSQEALTLLVAVMRDHLSATPAEPVVA
jgi:hypothetical protein